MKVLHIINNLGSGGAEKLIEEMLPIMNKYKGIEADVLLLTEKNNVFDRKLRDKGIKVNVVPLNKLYNPLNIYYIRKYIIEGEYDIVHSHLFPTIYWTAIASKLIFKDKPKFIMTEHSTHNRRRNKKLLQLVERFIYFSYDKIISISISTQNNLIDWLKPKKENLTKFIIINNGINIEKFKNAKPYKKNEINNYLNKETKLLCMIGRFTEAKDQNTIIKAIKILPKNIHLLLIGEGPLKKNSENLAIELGVIDRVHFLGFRSDIENILKTCDIIIQSSNWEGFGLAALEGMAAGKPVIVSNIPGLSEIVEGGGVFFKKGEEYDLAFKIKELLKNKNEYIKLSKLCFKKSTLYCRNEIIEEIVKLYRILLNK